MARAGRKVTGNKDAAKENDAIRRKLRGDVDARLKQLSQSEWFQEIRARALEAKEEAKEVDRAREALDRALRIRAGTEAPPWARELLERQAAPPPPPTTPPISQGATRDWIVAEVERIRVKRDIPKNIRITDLAKILADRFAAAAKSDKTLRKEISWRYIKNNLRPWSCWPI
jgi:hypothetical protein